MAKRRRQLARCACVALAAAVLGCGSEVVSPDAAGANPELSLTGGGGGACGNFSKKTNTAYAVFPDWNCGELIQVMTSGSGNSGALRAATSEWNSAFPASTGMPRFIATTQTDQITITGSTASNVTGVWSGTRGGDVNINLAAGTGVGSGSPAAVALHEVGHIMGLGNEWDGKGIIGVSDH